MDKDYIEGLEVKRDLSDGTVDKVVSETPVEGLVDKVSSEIDKNQDSNTDSEVATKAALSDQQREAAAAKVMMRNSHLMKLIV